MAAAATNEPAYQAVAQARASGLAEARCGAGWRPEFVKHPTATDPLILTESEGEACAAQAALDRAIIEWNSSPSDESRASLNAARSRFIEVDGRCLAERKALGLTRNPGRLQRAAAIQNTALAEPKA